MTICETLAIAENGNRAVVAERRIDKYSNRPIYIVSVCDGRGFEIVSAKAAKTTWKRRFSELKKEWRIEK